MVLVAWTVSGRECCLGVVLAELVLLALDNSETHHLQHCRFRFACCLLGSFPWEEMGAVQFQLFERIQA